MTESETFLLDELYESEAAIRSDAHQEDVKRLAAMERETETLQAKIAAKVSRRALAILAWKQSAAYSEDVHAAVEAIAGHGPGQMWATETSAIDPENWAVDQGETAAVYQTGEPQPVINDASHYYDPNADDCQPLRKVVGSAMDVSDEQLAEARAADARDAERPKWANGSDV